MGKSVNAHSLSYLVYGKTVTLDDSPASLVLGATIKLNEESSKPRKVLLPKGWSTSGIWVVDLALKLYRVDNLRSKKDWSLSKDVGESGSLTPELGGADL